ncbi:MAG: hypothetical protein OES69_19260 [Myxococcales bacterium]|nr:hypothetical protein [Myxococcales bacterium]MDH3846086.1 hypothetical protein [Myxococcales bacterium]
MRRSLEVLGASDGDQAPPPQALRAADTTLIIVDEGDGSASSQLVSCMEEAGATQLGAEPEAKANPGAIRIVIRARGSTIEARKRSALLEAAADVVLGSARPAFARRLVEVLLGER